MGAVNEGGPPEARLRRLSGYLNLDPGNLSLLADAAEAAFNAGELEAADRFLREYGALQPLPPQLLNIQGLVALSSQRFDDAGAIFSELLRQGQDDPAVVFNLAWSKAMLGDYEGTSALLDDRVIAAAPAAAALKIRALHHLGQLEEALAIGRAWVQKRPDDTPLMAALSIVAMDAGDVALARTYALGSRDQPDALASLGMLSLDEDRVGEAGQFFDKALAASPDNARALLGKGLELMVRGDLPSAALRIDRAAELFDRHIGSWVASGWAHVMAGDRVGGRASFERALALDDRFAETQGALAVLAIVDGAIDEGERRTEIALRLDRNCLSAVLAKTLLLNREGRGPAAERILSAALNRPLDETGRTIAQSMVRLGVGRADPRP